MAQLRNEMLKFAIVGISGRPKVFLDTFHKAGRSLWAGDSCPQRDGRFIPSTVSTVFSISL